MNDSIMNAPQENTRGDSYYGKVPIRIPTDILRQFSELNPWITCGHILMEWIFLIGTAWLCTRYWHPLLYVAAVFWLGGRLHAFATLMHEGVHYVICKNKHLNDLIADVFCAWPLLITTANFRGNHWEHHKYTNTDKDPDCLRKLFHMKAEDWEFPTSWKAILWMFLKDLSGIGFYDLSRNALNLFRGDTGKNKSGADWIPKYCRILYYALILSAAVYFNFWKGLLLFWFVPFVTTFNIYMRLRSISEHFATENENPFNITRTTICPWWESVLFGLKNINIHIDHHFYPSVPFFRLPKFHDYLMQQEYFRGKAHVTHGYFAMLRECVELKGSKKTCLPAGKTVSQVA
jgi:fatty acid desaturase